MEWNKFDKDTLTPYEKLGNAAKTFNGEIKIFSYMAIRHIALLAYKAGVASQHTVEAGRVKAEPHCTCNGDPTEFCEVHDGWDVNPPVA